MWVSQLHEGLSLVANVLLSRGQEGPAPHSALRRRDSLAPGGPLRNSEADSQTPQLSLHLPTF